MSADRFRFGIPLAAVLGLCIWAVIIALVWWVA